MLGKNIFDFLINKPEIIVPLPEDLSYKLEFNIRLLPIFLYF